MACAILPSPPLLLFPFVALAAQLPAAALSFGVAPPLMMEDICPPRCECQRSMQQRTTAAGAEHKTAEEESSEEQEEAGLFSVRCLRGALNDTEFLAILQSLPADVRELEIRAPPARPNTLQWNDNINRLSRLHRLVLTNSGIPALSQSVRLPLLRELDLSGNALEHVQLGSFLGMPMLERLDLSHNRLSHLPTGAFIYLKRLGTLSLAHNRLSTELTTGNLLRGPRELRELHLDGNRLSARQLDALFPDVDTLRRLELNHCGLNDAEVWALNLSAVPALRRIGLGGNNLTQVPSTTLRALALLDTVDLSDNLIRTLGPCAFCGSNISRVLLARNLLGLTPRPISREAFAETRMRELDLSYNHFGGTFNSATLQGAQDTLEVLHLSGNALPMSYALLGTLPRLRELHLADSALGSVPYSLPKGYGQLTLLNLSSNGLDMLPPNMGTLLPRLRVLDLSHNQFSHLPHSLMANFVDHLQLVYLHHCPWDCECAAQPLQVHMLQRLGSRELLRYEETQCARPALLRGQSLHRVQKINDCAILFGANYGITQNTELMLILGALLLAALVLTTVLLLSLYCGREHKQKGTYVTGERRDAQTQKRGKVQTKGGSSSNSTLATSNGMLAGRMLDLDMMAIDAASNNNESGAPSLLSDPNNNNNNNGTQLANGLVGLGGGHFSSAEPGRLFTCSPLTVQSLHVGSGCAPMEREPLLLQMANSRTIGDFGAAAAPNSSTLRRNSKPMVQSQTRHALPGPSQQQQQQGRTMITF